MSSIKRRTDYVIDTVSRLMSTVSGKDLRDLVVVLHLADPDTSWVDRIGLQLQQNHRAAVIAGQLHAIHLGEQAYPKLDVCPPFCPSRDPPQVVRWKAKQNVDYAVLMYYSMPLASYYIQLEDDLNFAPNWFPTVTNWVVTHYPQGFLSKQNAPWRILDFSGRGCGGKMYQAQEVTRIAQFLLLFYDQMLCEKVLPMWMRSMTQPKPLEIWRQAASPFQHAGTVDSLAVHGGAAAPPPVQAQAAPRQPQQPGSMVQCGIQQVSSCEQCEQSRGPIWCRADCAWFQGKCFRVPPLPGAPGGMVFDNPPGSVIWNMTDVPTYSGAFIYKPADNSLPDNCDFKVSPNSHNGGLKCWFWGKRPFAGNHVTLIFNAAINLDAFSVEFGHPVHARDILRKGQIEAAPDPLPGNTGVRPVEGCGHFTPLVQVVMGTTISWSSNGNYVQNTRCIRILVLEDQPDWLVILRVLVKSAPAR